LRVELAACEARRGATTPVLRQLLKVGENLLLSEEIVARIRGMLMHVSSQLLRAQAEASGNEGEPANESERLGELLTGLLDQPALLHHVHALAIEAQLGEFFRIRSGIDPVLAPMLQTLIASKDAKASASGMVVLAAQARFAQSQRRMELPLGELPADSYEAALGELRKQASAEDGKAADAAISALRDKFDESSSRLSLLSHLISSLEGGPASALSIEQAGVGLFATAVAAGSDQSRDTIILATNVAQSVRLALMLRIAGLSPQAVATQLLTLHPEMALPAWLADLTAEQASALLSSAASGELD
jgi:hypothetical protein